MPSDPPRRLVLCTAPRENTVPLIYDQPKFQMANQMIYFWLAILSEQNFILILYSGSAIKRVWSSQEGHCEKRCVIQGGSQEMAVMIG